MAEAIAARETKRGAAKAGAQGRFATPDARCPMPGWDSVDSTPTLRDEIWQWTVY